MAASWTTTYSGLVTLLQTYVEDTSTEFTNNVQGIINRAEERVIRDVDLGLFDETQTSTTNSGQAYVSRPSSNDPGSIKWIRINGALLKRRSYEYLVTYGGSGAPIYYHETDDYIYVAPTPDQTYSVEIRYLSRPTALSVSSPTNWLTSNAATALLNASLIEAEQFLIAPERVAEFEAAYAKAMGPLRSIHRENASHLYQPLDPSATPAQTR
jgi:hypothetical protein